jgi:hypothetical protein
MRESFLSLSASDQRDALEAVRFKTNRPVIQLEKDVWVVWALGALYTSPQITDLTFKGGTSLSKAYRLIDRFSEDIDLTYDIRKIIPDLATGSTYLPGNRSQAKKWTDAVRDRLPKWIRETVKPVLDAALQADGLQADIDICPSNGDRLLLHYPTQNAISGYIKPVVTLEFGARSTGEPHELISIVCDMQEHAHDLVFPTARPRVMTVARTFWEKATAAHVYCSQQRVHGARYSRHWYDLAAIARSSQFDQIIVDHAVALAVAHHKSHFFQEKSADGTIIDYRAAVAGQLRLVPAGAGREALAEDYGAMISNEALQGGAPSFDQLMDTCEAIERRANRPQST